MRLEQLSVYIVPLCLLGLYALTWVLNRDAQPLPPRPVRRERAEEVGSNPGSRPEVVRDLGDFRDPSTSAVMGSSPFSPQPGRAISRSPVLGPGDAIVFTETQNDRPPGSFERPTSQRPARGPQNRRAARAKNAVGPKPRTRPVPEKTRELTQEISNSMAQLKGKPLELSPLNLPLSPLTTLSLNSSTTMSATAPTPEFSKSAPGLINVRETLADPAKLREMFVWTELLQPPLALRKGPYRRR